MKKLEKTKANSLDQVGKRIEKYVELYDSPMIHDPMTNTFKTEKQFVHDENKRIVDTLNKYEDGANIPEQVIKYSPKKVPNHIKDKMIEQYLTRDKDTSKRTKPDPKAFIKHRQKLGNVLRNQKDKKVVLLNKVKPLKIDYNLNNYKKDNNTDLELKKLEDEINKPDPDFFRGLGMFLPKKF